MSRIYISGKITGLEKSEYMKKFANAQVELIKLGYEVINPTSFDALLPSSLSYEDYMKLDLTLLDICDGIYMLDNWQDSNGANMELERAKKLGLKVYYETPVWKQKMLNAFVTR